MYSNNIIAITGPTASGKSDLAINLAQKLNSVILSVDSLAVFKEIDIASAKPSPAELAQVRHFGVNELYPNEKFSVIEFLKHFKEAREFAKEHNKGLIIVGGTSFYLKVLSQGISDLPKPSSKVLKEVANIMQDLDSAYKLLQKIDLTYSQNIASSDRYRIEKALTIYKTTNQAPSIYFKENPQKPIVPNLDIYEITIPRDILRERIAQRTKKMLNMGLIDEVAYLEHKYTREPQSMGSIGIKEVLDFFDGKYNKNELLQKITTNTARLAKRQVTFNKSQLNIKFSGSIEEITALF
jgi:tRNA dimethylallyltransferase